MTIEEQQDVDVDGSSSSSSSSSNLLTFELQLKTFPSMIASDLYHNVIYKVNSIRYPRPAV